MSSQRPPPSSCFFRPLLSALVAPFLGGACADAREHAASVDREALMDPETCRPCHAQHYDEWATSMHAYAADDPVFIAMNKRGQREAGIGTFCLNCHAPLAVRTGATSDSLNLDALPQKLKGVTCYFCHSVEAVQGTHDNPLALASDGRLRGPLDDAVENRVHASVYAELLDRDKLASASLCGSCHDIVNARGTHIERTYAEWQASVFSQARVGTTCGQCHMDQSKTLEPIAQAPGARPRRRHSHAFPGVDAPLTGELADATVSAMQSFLDTSLQSALCVRGVAGNAQIQVVLDNVAAGHSWPSGASQDRRAWVEVVAYAAGAVIYQSGVVPAGASVTDESDPDLWLLRDCLFDEQGGATHDFWQASSYESSLLSGQQTFDASDPRFYQTHIFQNYPTQGSLPALPDRVTARVYLQPIGLDVFDELVASGDLADANGVTTAQLRERLRPWTVGQPVEWTADAATERFVDGNVPVACVSRTNLLASTDKVARAPRMRCSP